MAGEQTLSVNSSDVEIVYENFSLYGEVNVTAINSCDQKSQPAILNLPSSGTIVTPNAKLKFNA